MTDEEPEKLTLLNEEIETLPGSEGCGGASKQLDYM